MVGWCRDEDEKGGEKREKGSAASLQERSEKV